MAANDPPWRLTLAEAARLIRGGELSPVELVESCLERINEVDGRVKAWALVDAERALVSAHRLQEELTRGERRGPLHGVPVGVKDIFHVTGMATEAGSRSMAGFIPEYDAACVVKLKEAGAIVLGKTHTTEFALFDPAPTRNPWNLEHTPGGSSAGSGAAVAAGMCPAALGSQTAGSVLRPAAFNGVVGFKPRHGRVSVHGVIPVSWTLDHVGVLVRSVEDAALMVQAIAGHDPKDPYSIEAPVPDYFSAPKKGVSAPRLGLVREYFFEQVDEESRQHTERTVAALRGAGAVVDEVSLPPSFAEVRDTMSAILQAECAAYHRDRFGQRRGLYGSLVSSIIEQGLQISAVDYLAAKHRRRVQQREMEPIAARYDALITPGATGPAPRDLTSTGDPAMQLPWSVLGFPSISLPTGLSEDGMPLALQMAASPEREARLLWAARWCEAVVALQLHPTL